jgi:hypothetical protein
VSNTTIIQKPTSNLTVQQKNYKITVSRKSCKEVTVLRPSTKVVTVATPGPKGSEVELQNNGTYVQWKYLGDSEWKDLVLLADLEGEKGDPGQTIVSDTPPPSPYEGLQWFRSTDGRTFIYYDGHWVQDANMTVVEGPPGKEVELRNDGTNIQWKYDKEPDWNNLVSLQDLTGDDGREVQLQNNGTHIQWRYVGDLTWTNLVPLTDITGPAGLQGEKGEKGDTGSTGLTGPQGAFGGNTVQYTFENLTTDSNPSVGFARLNNSNRALVTKAFVSKTSNAGATMTDWLNSIASGSSVSKSVIMFGRRDAFATNYARYYITGIEDATGYVKLNLTYIDHFGTLNTTGANLLLSVSMTGDKGEVGPNQVSTATSTDINGLLFGSGSLVSSATIEQAQENTIPNKNTWIDRQLLQYNALTGRWENQTLDEVSSVGADLFLYQYY